MEQHDLTKMIRLWQAPSYRFVARQPELVIVLDRNSASPSPLGKQERDHPNQNIDRFSSLPDDIIHHIFSFLGPEAFVAIGMVSKRCRQMFMSSPYLSFSFISKTHFWPDDDMCNCDRFCVFLLRYLTFRERSFGIKRLCLEWLCDICHHSSASYTVATCLIMKKFNVEELDIDLGPSQYVGPLSDIPISVSQPWILNGQTLKSLKLHLGQDLLQIPLVSLNVLEVLSISQASISESEDFSLSHWIFSCCPLLKKLHLMNVIGMGKFCLNSAVLEEFNLTVCSRENFTHLDISTEKLKFFYMYNEYTAGFESVRIKAPSLQSLKWIRGATRQCSFTPATCLRNCVLDLQPIRDPQLRGWIFKLVDGIKTSRALQINVLAIEELFRRGYLPIEFLNLHHLDITVGEITGAQVPAIFSFLQGLPNLQKLSMIYDTSLHDITSLDNNSRGFDFVSEYTNLLSDHLSEMEIALAGFNAEIGMVEHLLKHARGLKKMFIYCSKRCYDLLVTKIRSFETASSQVAISICYHEEYNCRHLY